MITLYDFASKVEGNAHNANCWKARYSLNYKGLPYKTEWVEYVDTQALGKKLGAKPVVKCPWEPDRRLMHTLPMIYDDATGAVVTDSALIAEYLDKNYPDTPALFPAGTRALQAAFNEALQAKLSGSKYIRFFIPRVPKLINEASLEYVTRTRAAMLGVARLEDMAVDEASRETEWAKVKDAFGAIDAWMKKEDVWVMGDRPSFADFVLASAVMLLKDQMIQDSATDKQWQDVMSWHDGRWARLVENMKKYSTIQ